jgi:hypothetical protein
MRQSLLFGSFGKFFVLCASGLCLAASGESTNRYEAYLAAAPKDLAWFREARFGLFITWCPVSILGTDQTEREIVLDVPFNLRQKPNTILMLQLDGPAETFVIPDCAEMAIRAEGTRSIVLDPGPKGNVFEVHPPIGIFAPVDDLSRNDSNLILSTDCPLLQRTETPPEKTAAKKSSSSD